MNQIKTIKPGCYEPKISKKNTVIKLLILMSFFISMMQLFGLSRDYMSYDLFFTNIRSFGFEYIFAQRFEPLFSFISWGLTLFIENNLLVYTIFVFFSLSIKGLAMFSIVPSWHIMLFISMFYFARFFPLHEMTQIRAAIAISFLLLSMKYSFESKKKMSLLFGLTALGFHFSSFIFIPFIYFFRKWEKLEIILLGTLILLLSLCLNQYILRLVAEKVQTASFYISGGPDVYKRINPFNSAVLLDLFMIICGFFFWKKSTVQMRHILFLQIIGLAIFWGFGVFGVFAHRWREMISVFWILYFAQALIMKGMIRWSFGLLGIVNIFFYSYLTFFSRHAIF